MPAPFRRVPLLALAALLAAPPPLVAGPGLGLAGDLLADAAAPGDFVLAAGGQAAPVWLDPADHPGVLRAANDLLADIGRVTGVKPRRADVPAGPAAVLIGTLGRSAVIDALAASGRIPADRIAGKWESFVITTLPQPRPGLAQALVIAGSDKRGTIYGIYELCEQIGVSPWHWWADVPVRHRDALVVKAGTCVEGPPAVQYRGIFLNDEEPALGPWAREKFGGVNSKMYAHVFELILRLRGNYLWPAMWGKSITEDDPASPRLADEYGVVLGTSHHEPMTRAQQDWTQRKQTIGNGEWNYATNREGLLAFWEEGIRRNRDFETLVTIGMRGDGDEPMVKGGDLAANIRLLETIVADQRRAISRIMGREPARVPQLWALYKEVSDYYDHGMQVPDDVTLLWCDDNWGNLRRLPTPAERRRTGGAGIYYHFDYVGSPRCYKWVNTNPLPKVWEQMNLAFESGADRVWIVNVGDLKPMELPIEFFLRLAWNPRGLPKEQIQAFTRRWAAREFGPDPAAAIAGIVADSAKFNAWRKPELLEPTTFSLVHHREAERVLEAWRHLVARAEQVEAALPAEFHDAFFQLVLHPAKASATVAELQITTGLNRLQARQQRASAHDQAARVRQLFRLDQRLTDQYHQLRGGKWNHMMAQTHIGYSGWRDPPVNVLPKLEEPVVPAGAMLGVAVEGSEAAWPGGEGKAVLPAFDSRNRQQRWIEVFRRGRAGFAFRVEADQPWVKYSPSQGTVDHDQRLWVTVDWSQCPEGHHPARITVTGPPGQQVEISLEAVRDDRWHEVRAFGGLTGATAIAAEDATANRAAGGARWEAIPDYGRGQSGLCVFPVTSPSASPPANSPHLEYPVLIPKPGEIQVDLLTGPSLNVQPDRGLRIAVSFDDQAPRIIDAFANQAYADPRRRPDLSAPAIRDWARWVADNSRTLRSTHRIDAPGVHTLKVWMVDPGVVLETIVVNPGESPTSYFGPPPSAERSNPAPG